MITNEVLQEKYRIQKKLSKITRGNAKKYKKLLDENRKELAEKNNFSFKHLK